MFSKSPLSIGAADVEPSVYTEGLSSIAIAIISGLSAGRKPTNVTVYFSIERTDC